MMTLDQCRLGQRVRVERYGTGTITSLTDTLNITNSGIIEVMLDSGHRGTGSRYAWRTLPSHCTLLAEQSANATQIYHPPRRYGPYRPIAKALP
jgi:hypothetical protein